MCSPAPVVLHNLEGSSQQSVPHAGREPVGVITKLRRWLAGWKQTLIAELASLGSPREVFL